MHKRLNKKNIKRALRIGLALTGLMVVVSGIGGGGV